MQQAGQRVELKSPGEAFEDVDLVKGRLEQLPVVFTQVVLLLLGAACHEAEKVVGVRSWRYRRIMQDTSDQEGSGLLSRRLKPKQSQATILFWQVRSNSIHDIPVWSSQIACRRCSLAELESL